MAAFFTRWLFGAYAVVLAGTVWGQALRPLPPVLRVISDETGALSHEQGQALAAELDEILMHTGVPIVLVVAETTRPESIEAYAERLAHRWQTERGTDTSRMLFIVLSMMERTMRVMPGRSLGAIDALLRGDDPAGAVTSLFRDGRYFDGLMLLANRLHGLIEGEPRHPKR